MPPITINRYFAPKIDNVSSKQLLLRLPRIPFKDSLRDALESFPEQQYSKYKPCRYAQKAPIPQTTHDPQRRTNPDRCRRCKARHLTARIAQNYPGTEKADAGQNSL